MKHFPHILLVATALLLPATLKAQAPDYSKPTSWVCRPGAESVCTDSLDATVLTPDGQQTPQPFHPADNPPIDCFYVYPTVSREQTPYADLTDSPEIQRTTNAQAGRLTSRCRVFAPLYRQATLFHLREQMSGHPVQNQNFPDQDILAAWNFYLAHDNHGRGVVLIGHSQGTIVLQQLLATAIDGAPAQALLVSAILAGDPSLGVPQKSGQPTLVGGTFQHIPVCTAAAQTGCAYPWGSFLGGTQEAPQVFGHLRKDALLSACANPAAPAGGSGLLKSYIPAPAGVVPTKWIEVTGQLSGACQLTPQGNGFHVTVLPGPSAELYTTLLQKAELRQGWGLHPLDISLVQGNILDLLEAETTTWQATHPTK